MIMIPLDSSALGPDAFTNKGRLKAGIKKIFIDDAVKNKANLAEIDGPVDHLAERLTNVIDDYVRNEFARMKEALVNPGAYTSTNPSSTEVVAITPGTIKDYQP